MSKIISWHGSFFFMSLSSSRKARKFESKAAIEQKNTECRDVGSFKTASHFYIKTKYKSLLSRAREEFRIKINRPIFTKFFLSEISLLIHENSGLCYHANKYSLSVKIENMSSMGDQERMYPNQVWKYRGDAKQCCFATGLTILALRIFFDSGQFSHSLVDSIEQILMNCGPQTI